MGGFIAWTEAGLPVQPGRIGSPRYAALVPGGSWLCRTRLPSGLIVVLVPSGLRTTFQPQR
jgi:hypothetical protein